MARTVKLICKVCNKEFKISKSRYVSGRGVFCSKRCKHNYTPKQIKTRCDYCNKLFVAKESELKRNKHHYCSRECYGSDYKNHYSDKNSSNWSGGKQRERHNGSYKYSDWRLKVYERDNFTCQNCGQKGGKLNAHHIFKWSEYNSLRFELWNGITLCEKCHKKEHSTKQEVLNGDSKER